jgi:mono/diheme cytochrome c family protein
MSSRFLRLALPAAAAMALSGPAFAQGAPQGVPQPAPMQKSAEKTAPAGDPAAGQEIYSETCEMCHGADGKGGRGGGVPFSDALSAEDIVQTATAGRNAMPAFETIYSDKELHDVAAYITQKLVKGGKG